MARSKKPTHVSTIDSNGERASFTVYGLGSEKLVRMLMRLLEYAGYATRRNAKKLTGRKGRAGESR